MSATSIALLGAIAGFTIYLGLPIGRLRKPAPKLRATLNALATGILLFLLWDVLRAAWEPIDTVLTSKPASAIGNGFVLAAGVAVGLLGLVYFDQWIARRTAARSSVVGASVVGAPVVGAPVVGAPVAAARIGSASDVASAAAAPAVMAPAVAGSGRPWSSGAGQLTMMIAVGIGLHNFAEGLAIGNSATAGDLSLAILLIIGFGLHNATEGFGIVAPMAASGQRPSWAYLALLGLIGGGPTFVGTLVGESFTNDTVSIAFLALAAGSILYVIIELLGVARRFNVKTVTTWALFAGLVAGFLTDAIVGAAGA